MRLNAIPPILLLISMVISQAPAQAQEQTPPTPAAVRPTEPSRIPFDRAWLGIDGELEFHAAAGQDLLYVAPGASLSRLIRILAWSPAADMPGRDAADLYFAEDCREAFPRLLQQTQRRAYYHDGEIAWSGRVVDADARARAVVADVMGVDADKGTLLFVLRTRLQAPPKAPSGRWDFKDAFKPLTKLFKQDLEAIYKSGKAVPVTMTGARITAPPVKAKAVSGPLADGKLDPAWFGGAQSLDFHNLQGIDYLWVKPGFELAGKSLRLDHWESVPLPPERNERDEDLAQEVRPEMPGILEEILMRKGAAPVTCAATTGDFRIVGRFVDIQEGHGLFPSTQEFDLKISDARTGELMVAVHHNSRRGDPPQAMRTWVERFSAVARSGLGEAYARSPRTVE